MPWLTTVGANTQTRFFQGTIVLGDGLDPRELRSPLGGGLRTVGRCRICRRRPLRARVRWRRIGVAGQPSCCAVVGAIARAAKSLASAEAGGVGMILYENSDDNNLFSDGHWVPSVHIDQTPGLAVKAYIAGTAEPSAELGSREQPFPSGSRRLR